MMSPSDLSATPVLNAFQNVALAIIIERQNKLNFSDQCQTKFLLPKSQNEFYDLLTIPSCTSPAKTKAKHMENGLIFHGTILDDLAEAMKAMKARSRFGSSPSRFKQLVATLTSSGGECQLQV